MPKRNKSFLKNYILMKMNKNTNLNIQISTIENKIKTI